MLLRRRVRMLLRLLHSSDGVGKGCTDFASTYVFIVFIVSVSTMFVYQHFLLEDNKDS